MKLRCPLLFLFATRLSPCLGSGSGPVECTRTDTFDAAVLVVHDGTSLDSLTSTEKQRLGEAFAKAYNEVNHPSYSNTPFCDATHYRHVKTVLVEPKDAYLTHEETSTHLARKNFIYKITGICDGACGDHNLFDEVSTSRRQLGLFTAANPVGTCSCSGGTNRGPAESDIMAKFQSHISTKVASNDLIYVKEVIDVVEVKPYSCSSATEVEDVDVIVDLGADADPADAPALEAGFLDAYNQLAKFYCDEDTTRVESVSMLGEVNATGHLIRGRRRLGKRRLFRKRQKTQESSGFDDGLRRLQETTISKVEVHTDTGSQVVTVNDEERQRMDSSGMKFRVLSTEIQRQADRQLSGAVLDSTCYCPVRPIAVRAMNETEFASSYNMTLAEEAATGALSTSYTVEEVVEASDD